LLFVGSMDYRPNDRAVAWFVEEVLPRLRLKVTPALDVVGRLPRHPALAKDVRYSGQVVDLAPWYERAHAVIVPLFEGSGTSLKVIEAMAYGRPVVATGVGARGLPVVAGVHYLEADDPDRFSEHLVVIARACEGQPGWLEEMLRGARAAITPLFWPNVVGELADTYRRECERALRR
jgi:glycosyltransferase involved in cell wall biosynthesis